MAKLGFLGLGIMGGPMAKRLLQAGHEVALWSYSKGKAEALGGKACRTPREVAEASDYVFLCVGDTAMSREVIFGKDGLVAVRRRASSSRTAVRSRQKRAARWRRNYPH